MTDQIEADGAVLALSALAHENRLAVFRLLVQAASDGMAVRIIDLEKSGF